MVKKQATKGDAKPTQKYYPIAPDGKQYELLY